VSNGDFSFFQHLNDSKAKPLNAGTAARCLAVEALKCKDLWSILVEEFQRPSYDILVPSGIDHTPIHRGDAVLEDDPAKPARRRMKAEYA
jgi:hypothetical protein